MFMLKLHFGYEKFSYIYFIIRRYKFVSQTLIPSVPNSSSQNLFSDSAPPMFSQILEFGFFEKTYFFHFLRPKKEVFKNF